MFRIEHDARDHIVRISVKGFWRPEDVPAFAKAVGTAALQARAAAPDFCVLIESLEFPVQSNEVADLMTSIMLGGTALTTGYVAIVVASQLNKLQAERTLAHPRVQIFLSLEEGNRWLDRMRRRSAG